MGYFKKHWSPDLQEDIVTCAEEVVRAIFSLSIRELIHSSLKNGGYY
jgi:hypothetical protein